MIIGEHLGVNEQGHLTIGGMDTVELVKNYGTPLYVMDETVIRNNCRLFKDAIGKYYGGNGLPLYASKTFCCKEICRVMKQEKMGLDVSSGGELMTAIEAGFPAGDIFFHGNNKTRDELLLAMEYGVGRIVVDNLSELERLEDICIAQNKTANIMLRIKPGVEAHTHEFIQTGQIDSKFGFALENGEADFAAKTVAKTGNINLCGVHCHIGSQIFDAEPFKLAAKIMFGFIERINKSYGFTISELNLGGGFGIKYTQQDNPPAYGDYIRQVSEILHTLCDEIALPMPKIYIEPGRSIAGPAGITLYTVGAVKEIKDVRNYILVDGGMNDNIRYALYKAPYTVLVANKANEPCTYPATIAGRCCESGDLIQENATLQNCKPGDIVVVLATGAYNYSMSMNYNRFPRPPVVFVNNGSARIVVKRESYKDLMKNDV